MYLHTLTVVFVSSNRIMIKTIIYNCKNNHCNILEWKRVTKRKFVFILIATIFIILGIITLGSNFITEIMWFKSTGYLNVFLSSLSFRLIVRFVSIIVFFIFVYFNLVFAGRRLSSVLSFKNRAGLINDFLSKLMKGRSIKLFFLGISLVVAIIFTSFTSSYWLTVQRYLHSFKFDVVEPLFNKDVGFYMFKLPFLEGAYQFAMTMIIVTLVLVVILYIVTFVEKGLKAWINILAQEKQVITLLALLLAVRAYGYRLSMYNLVYSPRGVAFGASYTDVHAVIPGLKVMTILVAILAALLMANFIMKRPRMILWTLSAMIIASIVLQGIYPSLIQQLQVAPNEFVKEEPYLKANIDLTLKAYNLDKVERKEFPLKDKVDKEAILESPTVKNLRMWDYRPLQLTYNQLQRIRPYYNFPQVDVDRYTINGQLRQVMMSARELDYTRIPAGGGTWVNRRMQYTHGYGVVMSPTNSATSEGLPNYFIKNIPPVSNDTALKIDKPGIYFGELTNEYVIVNTKTAELDYPSGESNVYTEYDGDGGIPLNFWSRLLFAIRFGDFKMLISSNFKPDSKIMFDRNILTMVTKIAPFISFDKDPYPVIANKKIYWIIDGYTSTDRYPYSEPLQGINYIRNSVKAVIDAYNGSINLYISDDTDPIIKSYNDIFKGMFKPLSEMDERIRTHIRYPEDLFLTQAEVYTRYHMEDTKVFYNKEDSWQIPDEVYGSERQKMEPYYTILQLPGEQEPEFVLMLPFTPATIENMRAWMAARSDGENYGKLVLYLFPKDTTVYGPMQVEARMNQDSQISQQLTLWDQRGSKVIRGNLLVLPINNSILYVRPIFIQGEQSQLPELARVIVAYGEQVAMGRTFEEAFEELFNETPKKETTPQIPEGELPETNTVKRANEVFEEAMSAQRQGDWATYGSKIDELGKLLKQMSINP